MRGDAAVTLGADRQGQRDEFLDPWGQGTVCHGTRVQFPEARVDLRNGLAQIAR